MRLICKYCGSEIEVEGNNSCPHCGGTLGEEARRERERLEKIAEEERKRQQKLEEEKSRREYEDRQNERWGKILLAFFAPFAIIRYPFLGIGRFFRRITYDIGAFLKVLGFIALVVIVIIVYKTYFAG